MYFLFLIFVLATLLQPPVSTNQADGTQRDAVNRELTRAFDTYPNLQMLKIGNAKETIRVPKHTGLTVADIRGVPLDNPAPRLVRKISYERRNIDRSSPGSAPYMSPGILPFRLDHFNCEFNYGGRHNYLMQDYASLHGFNMIHDYRRTTVQKSVFPTGTGISKWKGIEKFRKKWFQENGLRFARYDQLQETHFENSSSLGDPLKNQQFAHIMLDMEHPILAQANLKKQNWYPPSHRSLFEKTYYENYARTLTSTVAAYRLAGFKSIGIYGWQPFPRSWITMLQGKELPRHGWETYGKKVYGSVDVIHNSVYCPYLNSRNVAFVLASIDENVRRAKEMDVQKPVRPYFWPLISGGGSGYRWWRELPHPNEDQCAMIAMSFFTGIDGLVVWNWSGNSDHHEASVSSFLGKKENYRAVMVGKPFRMARPDGRFELFQRYDCLHVQEFGNNLIRFQKIQPTEKKSNYGISPDLPSYRARFANLKPYLRPRSEPISAVIEGLALVKPFEYCLKSGHARTDQDGLMAFRRNQPLLRHVENGKYHLVITYNPNTIRSGQDGEIKVKDFAGRNGVDLIFPADDRPRIFVVGVL